MCDETQYVWTTESVPGPPNELWYSAANVPAHRVFRTTIGSIDRLELSGNWVTFGLFQQATGNQPLAQYWAVYAVNVTSGESRLLAEARSRPATREIPNPTISGMQVVWDQVTAGGDKVIENYNITTKTTSTLAIPRGQYPLEPVIVGNQIVYLNGATDPDHTHETWLAYGGTITLFDPASGVASPLSAVPNARQMSSTGEFVAWDLTVPSAPAGAAEHQINLTSRSTGVTTKLTDNGADAVLDDTLVGWFDYTTDNALFAPVSGGRPTVIAQDGGPAYALCGNRVVWTRPGRTELWSQTIVRP